MAVTKADKAGDISFLQIVDDYMAKGVQVWILVHSSTSMMDRIATVEKKVPESKVILLLDGVVGKTMIGYALGTRE